MQIAGSRAGSTQEVVEQLLGFESTLDLEGHALTGGVLMWPLVRWRVLQHALNHALQIDIKPRQATTRSSLVWKLRHFATSFRRDPLRVRGQFDLLLFGSGAGLAAKPDGKWFDRINDYFALEHEQQTLVLDAAVDREYRQPRYVKHVAFHDAIGLRAAVRGRAGGGMRGADERAIERFLATLQDEVPGGLTPELRRRLTGSLSGLAAGARFLRDAYFRLFERTQPALVFLEDASYGGQAFVLKWAREAGIGTAEFQHGLIVPTHFAYNYAQALRDSPAYRPYLPQSLLTYGRYWSDNTRTASALVEIGNPHFDARRGELEAQPSPPGSRYVIVSQPGLATELVPLALALRAQLPPSATIVYRLHPNERRASAVYEPLSASSGFEISDSGDIYGLLHGAQAVIGCSSTVLFEAVGFGRPVFIYALPLAELHIPRNFGRWFSNAEELVALLATSETEPIDRDHYFRSNWRSHYRAFVSPYLRGTTR